MPIFDYKCTKCDHSVEKLVKLSDPAPVCTTPAHGAMEKQWTTPAFHFANGSGTDAGLAWSFPGRPLWS